MAFSTHIQTAEVRLWGRHVGVIANQDNITLFEYDPSYVRNGLPVAPLHMPTKPGVYSFPGLARNTYHGLPGMLADSLPDRFGNALINQWLARQGLPPEALTPIERLCYIHDRAMGALTFHPLMRGRRLPEATVPVVLSDLVTTARAAVQGNLRDTPEKALTELLSVGTSAGGARAKAVIAWNEQTGEMRSGQLDAPDGFSHWLLKFDGVGKDADLGSGQDYGRIEFAYYRMALAAGITMRESRLLEEHDRAHFLTRRFDREGNVRLHMQSLCALDHLDFNLPGAHSYEQWFLAIQRVVGQHGTSTQEALEQAFRRMVFNVLARNQDDHTKNIAFLMDDSGAWRLAPAFDVTFAWRPSGEWTRIHQMTIQGKRDHFTQDDLLAAAHGYLKPAHARRLIQDVASAVRDWSDYAMDAGLSQADAVRIQKAFRLKFLGL